jgi:hypothetical protein
MSKRIFLDGQGKLQSDASGCFMVEGTASRASAATAHEFARIIANCGTEQAIALGTLECELPDQVDVTVPRRLDRRPGAITRSRSFIDYLPGSPAWVLIDYDTKGIPDEVKAKIDAAGGMWSALLTVAPELADATRVSRASTSAGLFRRDTGEPIPGSDGAHHYVLVLDGGDVGRMLKDLHDRCWLHGFGWHLIGRAGQLLERSIVDRMVGSGERLCFEGAPIVVPPLAQDPAKRLPYESEGATIRSHQAVPRLTEYERHRVSDAKAKSAKALGRPAAEARNKHDKELAEKISAKFGTPMATALRQVRARHRGVLYPDVELGFDHLGIVTVGAVINDPDRYVGETLADPMEGVDYGRCKAMVMRGDDGNLFIHSFAHGRGIYLLRHDLKSAKAAFAQAPSGTVDHAMLILAQAELEADELDEFIRFISKSTGVGIRPLSARIKKEHTKRNADASMAYMEAEAEAKADGRIVLPRPEADGELMPTVTLLDEILVRDLSNEPPMRNASRALVRVEEKEPWDLHLLTSDGANAADDETDAMRPPVEPLLVELTPTCIELLLEKYVRWIKIKKNGPSYFAALPKAHIAALMQYPGSALPIVRAINTSPLINMSGRAMDGVGLDRNSGLFHRIDPVLRACLPTGEPTVDEIKEALRFLKDDWFIDVALDDAGKCVAIMLALTVLQRALLPERPAFFVTAGQRGGGKTTLITMIIAAVLGRRPAAAAWSDNAEERKKALFSYLRQSVAALVWDNISRGSNVTCSHIEAALTASEISDRVLGVSSVETVPATTVQIFTGNSIAPRGDMASRSFVLSLTVDRPDPENRSFAHADPLAWTLANRTKILSAFYTILMGGILRRPEGQVAKTRFKDWWSLIGWPVEYAAELLCIKLDCAELLRSNESKEEEASATSRVLTILRERWKDRSFTSRDVALVLEQMTTAIGKTAEQAEELFEALGELAGRTLERPTARYIGKLFQRHVTDRPVWIDNGKLTAILRKDSRHQENRYRVEILQPTAAAQARADTGTSQDAGQTSSSSKAEDTAERETLF